MRLHLTSSIIILVTLLLNSLTNPFPTLAASPSFSLTTSTPNPIVEQSSQINIILDTAGNETAGAGVKIKFNPQFIQITSIEEGTIFDNFIKKNFDNDLGTIHISTFANSLDSQFNGTNTLATLNFKALQSGSTNLDIIFFSGQTTDSNIAVTTGQGDILNEVHNLQLNIQAPSSPTPTQSIHISTTSSNTPSQISPPIVSIPTETLTATFAATLNTTPTISTTPTSIHNPQLSNAITHQRHFLNIPIPPQSTPISFTLSLIISVTSATLVVYLLYKITYHQLHPQSKIIKTPTPINITN